MRKYYKIPKSIVFSEVKVRSCIEKQINIKIDYTNEYMKKKKKNVISLCVRNTYILLFVDRIMKMENY